ncbi:hypothetical protein [Pseudomonas sp. T1.Ur]|uniref:hypothetical protein n=1 Tax=Pseudomonas sp. T1.Ur TaxID=2928704 RepID=UPI00201D8090|nr:hypothetical protein [Pseudomonas sp. T1.Ur]MCL6703292.1 hypothetical protein [Pseudomonas sp. T1.Ur]
MAAGDLQGPIIPLLINNTIDPQALNGGPLPTYAKYDNPLLGDILYQSWLGLAQDGTPVDVKDIPIPINPAEETQWGFLMEIANHFVQALDKGQVFYSFFLERVTGEPREESKRIHFGIGKDGWLSAPQIKESHDNQLDPDAIAGTTMTIAVVPYTVMSNGDEVKLFWTGTRENGTPGPIVGPFTKTLSDTDTDPTNNPGQVLSWTVPRSSAVALRGGSITLHYEISYVSPSAQADTKSAARTILVTPPTETELAAPSVKDLTGTVINPGQFPEGIRVVIALYPGIRIGDDVLVYGTRTGSGSGPNKNTIQHLKIDITNIESGKIEVPIAAQWLLDNRGGAVTLRYQYARADAAGSGIPLELTVREPLVLPTPTVDRSVVANGRDELNPVMAISGAYIAIPPAATIGDGDTVTAYWKGFGASGSCEVQEPSQLNPMKFKVPSTVLPPNFGKTVEVTYNVAGQDAEPPLQLFIRQLANHPSITCEHAEVGTVATLKLSDIPDAGTWLSVGLWPFISTEQTVRLWLTASGIADRDIIAVRQVLPEESTEGVKARLLKTDLTGIAVNAIFALRVSVSFDGGNSTVVFTNPLSLKLLA